jgi:hypothetical protein
MDRKSIFPTSACTETGFGPGIKEDVSNVGVRINNQRVGSGCAQQPGFKI